MRNEWSRETDTVTALRSSEQAARAFVYSRTHGAETLLRAIESLSLPDQVITGWLLDLNKLISGRR